MTLIKKTGSSYIIISSYNTFLFDYHTNIPFVDTIFISNSSNIEILYLTLDVPIYITRPVYTQLLYKQDKNRNISDLFYKNCIFINYNQKIMFNKVEICVLPSGLYFGWCMFKINDLLYFSDISFVNKICTSVKIIKDIKFILWGNVEKETKRDTIESFNECLKNNLKINRNNPQISSPIEIYVEFPNFLLDIVLHINLYFNISVRVDCPDICRFINYLNSESDWINDKYTGLNLNITETSKIILKKKTIEDFSIKKEDYSINVKGVNNNKFNISTSASYEDIKKHFSAEILDIEKGVYYERPDMNYEDVLVDGNLDLVNKSCYIVGEMINTDMNDQIKSIIIRENIDIFKSIFESENYAYIDGIYYFKRLGIKIYEEDGRFKIRF
ncbi:ribonuclease [Vairimorpha necatrix]|uniref:Ribonuclease n=1 Tax=Vairimorpha necatrix TaxID=6039 RepID=A0AAX4JE60_9MICR